MMKQVAMARPCGCAWRGTFKRSSRSAVAAVLGQALLLLAGCGSTAVEHTGKQEGTVTPARGDVVTTAPAEESKPEGARITTSSAPAMPGSPAPEQEAAAPAEAIGTIGQGHGGGAAYGRGGSALMARNKRIANAPLALAAPPQFDTEAYAHNPDNDLLAVADKPLSTFSIDVDTASYSNVRRFLRDGQRPPADAVRVEELINYFSYSYPAPRGGAPFSVYTEVGAAPWNPERRLVHIGLKGREIAADNVPPRNLVFLLDVSGSMQSSDKLPLLQRGMALLVEQLREQDRIAIVVYAGASGLVLPSTSGTQQGRIMSALESLRAGGSTNGAQGIELAYRVAHDHFIEGGINRVILATDGDFNVGVTSHGELTRLIERKREGGVFLTVLGFGRGNLKDSTMETLADKGNGNYGYIDSLQEARKVLVREAGSTLVTIAKDVKLQVEWNPKLVSSYRLIGYENRVLADRDFNDDKKDAGEIGAGHTVTALYEVVLASDRGAASSATGQIDPLRYQSSRDLTTAADSSELLTVKLRYKKPDGHKSILQSYRLTDDGRPLRHTSNDFRFAAAVAGFGMLLRGSEHRGSASLSSMQRLASSAVGDDDHGQRRELLELMRRAYELGIDG